MIAHYVGTWPIQGLSLESTVRVAQSLVTIRAISPSSPEFITLSGTTVTFFLRRRGMLATRIPMKKIIEVLHLKYEAQLSHEKIACSCQLTKGAVNKYVSLARCITWPLPEGGG